MDHVPVVDLALARVSVDDTATPSKLKLLQAGPGGR